MESQQQPASELRALLSSFEPCWLGGPGSTGEPTWAKASLSNQPGEQKTFHEQAAYFCRLWLRHPWRYPQSEAEPLCQLRV